MEVRKLEPKEWLQLKKIFSAEFDSDLPLPQNAEIYGIVEAGKVEAFILLEQVTICGQIYVNDENRHSNYAKSLLSFVRNKFSRERKPVAAVASEKRFELLYKSLGMFEVGGKLFRRN